jgi:hypothetical protein
MLNMNSSIEPLKEAASLGAGGGAAFFALRWVVVWVTARLDRRQAQIDAEEAALAMSWKDYRIFLEQRQQLMETEMKQLSNGNKALRLAFEHVATALIRIDPQNPALERAGKIMAEAFPLDFTFPLQMAGGALDKEDAT